MSGFFNVKGSVCTSYRYVLKTDRIDLFCCRIEELIFLLNVGEIYMKRVLEFFLAFKWCIFVVKNGTHGYQENPLAIKISEQYKIIYNIFLLSIQWLSHSTVSKYVLKNNNTRDRWKGVLFQLRRLVVN